MNPVFKHGAGLASNPFDQAPVLFDHFVTGYTEDGGTFSTTADKGMWLVSADTFTSHGQNPIVLDGSSIGEILFDTDDDSGDHTQIQLNGTSFKAAAGKKVVFAWRLKPSAITMDAVVGAGAAATDAYATKPTDGVYIEIDGDASIDFVTRKDSAQLKTDTGVDIVAGQYVDIVLVLTPEKVWCYITTGGVTTQITHDNTTYIPTASLSPLACAESNGAEEGFTVDAVYANGDA